MERFKRFFIVAILILALIYTFSACQELPEGTDPEVTPSETDSGKKDDDTEDKDIPGTNEFFSAFDVNVAFDMSEASKIDVSKGTVTITDPGTYILTGTLENGQIIVNTDKANKVRLVLDNVSVTCADGSAIYVMSADKVLLHLPEGTTNTFTDGKKYKNTDMKACIYSEDDLSINGSGDLVVYGNHNNGIATKNDLRISGGNITVKAFNNALKGNDSVAISGGNITITGCEDGIKTDSTDLGEGYVNISGGTFNITSNDDGIQASQKVIVTGGSFTMKCKGDKVNSKGTKDVGTFFN